MKYLAVSRRTSVYFFMAMLTISTLLLTGRAQALNNTFPDQADSEAGAVVRAVSANTQYVQQTDGKLRVWSKSNSFNVVIQNGHFCNSNPYDYVETSDGSWGGFNNGAAVTRFRANIDGTTIDKYGRKYANGDSRCNDQIVFNFSNISRLQAGTDWYYIVLDIDYYGDHNGGWDGAMNYYNVLSTAGSVIGLPGSTDTGNFTGYTTTQEQVDTTPNYTNYTVQFGTPCNVTTNQTATVYMYDLDNAGGGGAQPASGPPVSVQIRDLTDNTLVDFHGATGDKWTPADTQNAVQSRSFTAKPDHKYRMVIQNVYWNNTIQYGAPYSQIYRFACPPPPPPGTIRPVVGLPGTGFEPGGQATATASVTKNGGTGTATSTYARRFWYENTGNTTFDPSTADQNIQNVTGQSGSYPNSGSNSLTTWTSPPIPANAQRICTTLFLTNPGAGFTIAAPNPTVPVCRDITRKPYFEVLNGDINTSCNNGSITSFWNPTTSNGSGAELAAFAGAAINGFATRSKSVADPTRPKQLTFANNLANNFGNDFNGQVDCGAFPGVIGVPAGNVSLSSLSDPRIINDEIRVNGNLYITSDLLYANKTGLGIDNLPAFRAIVSGDIYVYSGVTQLDGVYQSNGTIYTCTNGNLKPTDATLPGMGGICSNNLTVRGAFTANAIKYLRLTGTTSTPGAAETFIYDPLVWLQGLSPNITSSSNGKFDAYTTLPPIL